MSVITDIFQAIMILVFLFFGGISFGAGFCVAWEVIKGGKR